MHACMHTDTHTYIHYVTLHYVTLHCVTSYHITSHHITYISYIPYIPYIHTYIHTYLPTYIHTYICIHTYMPCHAMPCRTVPYRTVPNVEKNIIKKCCCCPSFNFRLWPSWPPDSVLQHLIPSGASQAQVTGPVTSISWSRGVTVSTLDSESSDRGSNPRWRR